MEVNESTPKTAQSLGHSQLNLLALSGEVERAKISFNHMEENQNKLGTAVDWVRNHLGGSFNSSNPAGRLWSNVISSDEGSEGVQKQIDLAQDILKRASNPDLGEDGAFNREAIAGDAVTKSIIGVASYRTGTFRGGELAQEFERP